jgi:hypothetical protein
MFDEKVGLVFFFIRLFLAVIRKSLSDLAIILPNVVTTDRLREGPAGWKESEGVFWKASQACTAGFAPWPFRFWHLSFPSTIWRKRDSSSSFCHRNRSMI